MDEQTKCAIAHFDKKVTDYQIYVDRELQNQNEQLKSAKNYLINTLDSQDKKINDFINNGGVGAPGEDGVTFTPVVSDDGVLSWTNNKGLENPAPVNLKGLTEEDKAEIKAYIDGVILGNVEMALGGI